MTEASTQHDTTERTTQPVVELQNVEKTLSGFRVLDGLNLKSWPGETLVIIGRSGSGKSVTIRHIVGLMEPDAGNVFVFGDNPWEVSKEKRKASRLRIGYLFQSGALLNWMTIEENVELPLIEHCKDMTPKQREERVLEKLRLVQLESAKGKFPSEISGGMKKRAALARAIVLEPDIILYDEPTSGLDPVIASTINELILDTQKATGATQIVVTHDMESAYRIADRIAMLYQGKIIATGTPEELQVSEHPIVRQFIHGQTTGPLNKDD